MIDVLYVVANLQLGGVERLVADWVLAIHPAHGRCAVLCLNGKTGPLVQVIEAHGVAVYELPCQTQSSLAFARQFSALVRKLQPRVIHSQCHWSLPQQALPAHHVGVRTFILTIHSTYPRQGPLVELRRRCSTRLAAPCITHFVAVSEGVRRHACRLFGLRDSRVMTIHNGVDTAIYHPVASDAERRALRAGLGLPPQGPLLLNVAAHSRQKDQETLLRAFARLDADVSLALVGDGGLRPQLEATARALGILPRVHFLGVRLDTPAIYRAADVFVLSSRWEGLPLVLAEAMASALPVVATTVGGVGELVNDGRNGRLVPPGQPEALQATLRDLLRRPTTMAALAAAGRQTVCQQFSRERCLAGYRELYQLPPPPQS